MGWDETGWGRGRGGVSVVVGNDWGGELEVGGRGVGDIVCNYVDGWVGWGGVGQVGNGGRCRGGRV